MFIVSACLRCSHIFKFGVRFVRPVLFIYIYSYSSPWVRNDKTLFASFILPTFNVNRLFNLIIVKRHHFKSIVLREEKMYDLRFNQGDELRIQIRSTRAEFDQYAPYFCFEGKSHFCLPWKNVCPHSLMINGHDVRF